MLSYKLSDFSKHEFILLSEPALDFTYEILLLNDTTLWLKTTFTDEVIGQGDEIMIVQFNGVEEKLDVQGHNNSSSVMYVILRLNS